MNMKRFLLALLFALLAWVQPVMAQDAFDSFSEPDGGAWNSQEAPTILFLPMGGTIVLNGEEARMVRDAASKAIGNTPGGFLIKPLFDKVTKGEAEQDDMHELYWRILVAILAIYVLADDFIWMFKNWAKAGAWKVVKKIFIIVATFVSIPIPVWDIIFLVIRAVIKVIKAVRTTKRVVRTAKAVSKAGENPQAAAAAAKEAAAAYSAKRAADGRQQTQRQPGQESGRPQTETTAQTNALTPGQSASAAVEQPGGRNSAQAAHVQKRLDEVEQLWREPRNGKKNTQAQESDEFGPTKLHDPSTGPAKMKDPNAPEAEQKKPETGNPLNKRYEKMPAFEGEKLYDPSKGPIKMADPNAPASAQKKPTRQGRRADMRGKRAAPSAGMRRGSRTRTRA